MDKIKEPDADDLRDSIKYNQSHADEHLKAVDDREKALKKIVKARVKAAKK